MLFPKKLLQYPLILLLIALGTGLACGTLGFAWLDSVAVLISELFVKILRLAALPLIFISLTATLSGMGEKSIGGWLGKKALSYALITTLIASFIGLVMYLLLMPESLQLVEPQQIISSSPTPISMWNISNLINWMPNDLITPFMKGNVVVVLLLGIWVGTSSLYLPEKHRVTLNSFFSASFSLVIQMLDRILIFLPIAVWAFSAVLSKEFNFGDPNEANRHLLFLYLGAVLSANLLQGFIILPGLVLIHKLSPIDIFKGMLPALYFGFFSKSTSATLPVTMRCAEENLNIDEKVSRLLLPLCGTINMNACASFILLTVLFVAQANGWNFSPGELLVWVFISTLGAFGNAAVPMGCFFVASAFLSTMEIPLNLMAVILPFYALRYG